MKNELKPFEIDIKTLGFHVNRVHFQLMKMLSKGLREKDLGIQFSEFTILKVLDEIKSVSQTQLAILLGKDRSAMNRPLLLLEQNEYILRESMNGSTNKVTLTEKGKKIIPIINEVIEDFTNQALQGFTKKSRDAVYHYLTRIYENIQEK